MRAIKFRAWDATAKEMCQVLMVFPGDAVIGMQWIDKNKRITLSTTASAQGVDIMQFTGMVDKNGKEIYESDIVRYAYDWDYSDKEMKIREFKKGKKNSYVARVDWESGEYAHFVMNPHRMNLASTMHLTEVIGNIYETPELLPHDTKSL